MSEEAAPQSTRAPFIGTLIFYARIGGGPSFSRRASECWFFGGLAWFELRRPGDHHLLWTLGPSRASVTSRLRRSQTTAEWIASLQSIATNVSYRVAPISREQLWRILENPAASPSDRVAAQIALREAMDENGRERSRKTIDACAEPRLRVALDAAIAEDESQLEAALDALDAENENRNEAEK